MEPAQTAGCIVKGKHKEVVCSSTSEEQCFIYICIEFAIPYILVLVHRAPRFIVVIAQAFKRTYPQMCDQDFIVIDPARDRSIVARVCGLNLFAHAPTHVRANLIYLHAIRSSCAITFIVRHGHGPSALHKPTCISPHVSLLGLTRYTSAKHVGPCWDFSSLYWKCEVWSTKRKARMHEA